MSENTSPKKRLIISCLLSKLEKGEKITTVTLAEAVGFTEAALYKHFSSKAAIFDATIALMKEALLGGFSANDASLKTVTLSAGRYLKFYHNNPSFAWLLSGDYLRAQVGTKTAQQHRAIHLQFQSMLKNVLRQMVVVRARSIPVLSPSATSELIISYLMGSVIFGKEVDVLDRHWLERCAAGWEAMQQGLFVSNPDYKDD